MDETLKHELTSLISDLIDDRLDAQSHDRFQTLLWNDPEAQRTYLAYLDTHLAMRKLFRKEGAVDGSPEDHVPLLLPLPCSAASFDGMTRPRRRVTMARLGIAATLLIAVTAVLMARLWPERTVEQDMTPRLIQSSGAKFFGRWSVPNGSRLPFGEEYTLTSGLLEIAFVDGATAIIRAPAAFEVIDRARLLMKIGRCSVHAPEGAQGFRVETPIAEIVDLGTRFSVDVQDTGEAEVQVVEGLAQVYTKATPQAREQPVLLTSGQAKKYSLNHEIVVDDVRFDATRYTSRLPDRIVRYDAADRGGVGGGAEELRSVTVQRDGEILTYLVADLIGIDLIHYKSEPKGSIAIGTDMFDPDQGDPRSRRRLALLDRDAKLTTGVINPGSSRSPLVSDPVYQDPEDPLAPNTPGFAVRFHEPVVNSPGPDVVLFDVQLIIHREKGDPFHVGPLRLSAGLRTHTVRDYDIDLQSPEARTLAGVRVSPFRTPTRALSDLLSGRHDVGRPTSVQTKGLAVGIDLSDLGYGPGETAEGLFFQAAPTDSYPTAVLDPVFIAGFPPLARPIARAEAPHR